MNSRSIKVSTLADQIFKVKLRCKVLTPLEHAAVNRRVVGSSPTGGAIWSL